MSGVVPDMLTLYHIIIVRCTTYYGDMGKT
jgi:hypothetical protein